MKLVKVKNVQKICQRKLTKVVWIPTLSAASKAIWKFRFFSLGTRVSYGTLSGRYVWSKAQKPKPERK